MAWRRPGDKPLSEPMRFSSLTHICVIRPQWVKMYWGTTFVPFAKFIHSGLFHSNEFEQMCIVTVVCCLMRYNIYEMYSVIVVTKDKKIKIHSIFLSGRDAPFFVWYRCLGRLRGIHWQPTTPGFIFKINTIVPGIGILAIKKECNRLIFTMWNPLLIMRSLYNETTPSVGKNIRRKPQVKYNEHSMA